MNPPQKFKKYFSNGMIVLAAFWAFSTALFQFIQIFKYFFEKDIFKNGSGLLVFIITAFFLTLVYIIINFIVNKGILENNYVQRDELNISKETSQFHRRIIDDCAAHIKRENLTKCIDEAFRNEDWQRVAELGKIGLKVFIRLARYEVQLIYGWRMLIMSKFRKPDNNLVAMALIDGIGWPLHKLQKRKVERICEIINEGIKLAKVEKNYLMVCRGYRHLVGIMLKNNNIEKSLEYRDYLKDNIKKLKKLDKKIMTAYLFMVDGDISFKKNDKVKSIEYYKKSYEYFDKKCHDRVRAIKLNYKLGQVHENIGEWQKATEQYLLGYLESNKTARIDEEYNNCNALVHLFEIYGDNIEKYYRDFMRDNKNSFISERIESYKSYYVTALNDLKDKLKQT
jgi:hypothetical protein